MSLAPGTISREELSSELRARLRGKAKPVGSLGRLEDIAVQIGMIKESLVPELGSARILVFAGDHGITKEGVTAYPSAVTREIAKLILAGTAGVNVLGEPRWADFRCCVIAGERVLDFGEVSRLTERGKRD